MSDKELCDAAEASCECRKPAGHVENGDPVHACRNLTDCGGEWAWEGDKFRVVRLPGFGALL